MVFYRFGDIPEDECSSIWNNNDEVIGKEKGVSVYEAHKNINGTYSPVIPFPTNEKAFNDFIYHIEYFTGNKYLVTGDLLEETGTDGEPLIKNVKILKELQLMIEKEWKKVHLGSIVEYSTFSLVNFIFGGFIYGGYYDFHRTEVLGIRVDKKIYCKLDGKKKPRWYNIDRFKLIEEEQLWYSNNVQIYNLCSLRYSQYLLSY